MPPFPQRPHCHQGPPFPHGGIGNPWLGPHSASYVNIQDPKQRRIAFDNVQEHVKEDVMEALGYTNLRWTSSSGTFVGISDTSERPGMFQ